jgi:hypothetical protein
MSIRPDVKELAIRAFVNVVGMIQHAAISAIQQGEASDNLTGVLFLVAASAFLSLARSTHRCLDLSGFE